jgi:hypothetical protein
MYRLKKWIKIYNDDIISFTNNIHPYTLQFLNEIGYGHLINKSFLSSNINEIEYLKNHPEEIDFYELSGNVNAIEILEKNIDKINYSNLCMKNYNAYPIFTKNLNKLNWVMLSENKNAILLISNDLDNLTWEIIDSKLIYFEKNFSKNSNEYYSENLNFKKDIFIKSFSLNENKNVLKLLEERPELIEWENIVKNPMAIHIIEKNWNEIELYLFERLCANPNAMHLILKHIDEFLIKEQLEGNEPDDFIRSFLLYHLSTNSSAINYLEKNQNKIIPLGLYKNPAIFEYDYEKMANNISIFKEELIQKAMHPYRIKKLLDNDISNSDLEYILDNL